jgi:hypothetical protein
MTLFSCHEEEEGKLDEFEVVRRHEFLISETTLGDGQTTKSFPCVPQWCPNHVQKTIICIKEKILPVGKSPQNSTGNYTMSGKNTHKLVVKPTAAAGLLLLFLPPAAEHVKRLLYIISRSSVLTRGQVLSSSRHSGRRRRKTSFIEMDLVGPGSVCIVHLALCLNVPELVPLSWRRRSLGGSICHFRCLLSVSP